MISKRKLKGLCFTLALAVMVAFLVSAQPLPAQAAADAETVGMFYDELAKIGTWVDYQNYGPVWYPSGVAEDWRPYVNGRWSPVQEGYVFETDEAWGWACYHYGNWIPTEEYGWVWVPGSTWYPHTVAWRSPPEEGQGAVVAGEGAAAEAEAYVGWTPVPPEDWTPPPAYYPPGCCPAGSPVVDIIAAPFWIFARATSFLLGYGQPYAPGYSYGGCGCLAPAVVVPLIFPVCPVIPIWGQAGWATGGWFGFGPSFGWIGGWGGVNINVVNININNFHGVAPAHHWQQMHHGAFPGQHLASQHGPINTHHGGPGAHKANFAHASKPPPGTKAFKGNIPKHGAAGGPKGHPGKLGKSLGSTKGTHAKGAGKGLGKGAGKGVGKGAGKGVGKGAGKGTGNGVGGAGKGTGKGVGGAGKGTGKGVGGAGKGTGKGVGGAGKGGGKGVGGAGKGGGGAGKGGGGVHKGGGAGGAGKGGGGAGKGGGAYKGGGGAGKGGGGVHKGGGAGGAGKGGGASKGGGGAGKGGGMPKGGGGGGGKGGGTPKGGHKS